MLWEGHARVESVFLFTASNPRGCFITISYQYSTHAADAQAEKCACCVRIRYERVAIGCFAAAFSSLCPYEVGNGDDHRSLLCCDGHLCDLGHALLVYDSMLFIFTTLLSFPFTHFWFC